MGRLFQIRTAFTLIEMLFVLTMTLIIVSLTFALKPTTTNTAYRHDLLNHHFISQIHYLKTRAIAEEQAISLSFYRGAKGIKVYEGKTHLQYEIPLRKGVVSNRNTLSHMMITKDGEMNRFGSIYLQFEEHMLSRFIFHIQKGRMRVEKLSS